jgi:hypothetical protein
VLRTIGLKPASRSERISMRTLESRIFIQSNLGLVTSLVRGSQYEYETSFMIGSSIWAYKIIVRVSKRLFMDRC